MCGIEVNLDVRHRCGMARDDLHFRLRIPEVLKDRIQNAADENGRSMTAEIVYRLERSFGSPSPGELADWLKEHERRIEQVEIVLGNMYGPDWKDT